MEVLELLEFCRGLSVLMIRSLAMKIGYPYSDSNAK